MKHKCVLYPTEGLDYKYSECKKANNFLSMRCYICFVCSKEPSHRDGSFEYIQICFG